MKTEKSVPSSDNVVIDVQQVGLVLSGDHALALEDQQ